ncbi:MAG TPA: phage major capsid protein [Rubrivivax sp.]|nr:phage major capsid protein [Rubrivivax sp.]
MTEINDDLVKQLTKSASSLETALSELRQRKENEYKDQLPDFEKSLADAIEQVKQEQADQMAELKAQVESEFAASKPHIEAEQGEHKSLGDWLAKTASGEIERKDFGEASGGVGGYMVPDQFVPQILNIPMEKAVVRPRATVVPMGSDTARVPALNADSHATNFYGGMLGYWLSEAAAITATSWTAKEVPLAVNTLAAAGKVSKQLLADSPLGMSEVIARSFGEVISFMEDQAFFDADGTGKPQGVIGSGCEVAQARAGAGDVQAADLYNMLSVFLGDEGRAVWCANRSIIPKLYAIKDGANNQLFIPNAYGIGPKPTPTLLGIPIVWTEKCSALGTKGDLILADWSYYLIGDRQQVVVDWSDHVAFLNLQSTVRLYERVDGKPWMDATHTPRKGAARSPFVILT